MSKAMTLALLTAMLLFVMPHQALAHKVNVYAWQEGGSMHSEAYFADGTRCMGCAVEVLDAGTGERLFEGETDDEGLFTFEGRDDVPLKVVVHAGPGHMGQYVLAPEGAAEEGAAPEAKSEEAITDTEAQRRIEDLTAELRRVREEAGRPGLTEIVGGLGWIVGIFGFIAYLKSRKDSK